MKNTTILLALLTAFCHPEGTSAQVIDLDGTATRAVVVGISDYQDVGIPDLRFADRDAQAFANFLRSLRERTEQWKALMKKYFLDKVRD